MSLKFVDPLVEYDNVLSERFKNVATQTFASLAAEAQINVNENRATISQINDQEKLQATLKKRTMLRNLPCFLSFIIALCGMAYSLTGCAAMMISTEVDVTMSQILLSWLIVIIATILWFVFGLRINQLNAPIALTLEATDTLKAEAKEQMKPINDLYDWDILTRMITQTMPQISFDPYFSVERLADLQENYDWFDIFDNNRSVLYAYSGLINGHPFIICRTRTVEMQSMEYHGESAISWDEGVADYDDDYLYDDVDDDIDDDDISARHSQVLTASVIAQCPVYIEETFLIYAHTAAPHLTFHRLQSGLATQEQSLEFKLKRERLQQEARDLENTDYAMMPNEVFETAFDTSDRNSNQEFALLFTSLAQNNMLKLLRDTSVGYGDDFAFNKNRMINTIISTHLQDLDLDMNPKQFHNFNFDEAQRNFYYLNAEYFRAIYFSLAPLLSIPLYQQPRTHLPFQALKPSSKSSFFEHESVANYWGDDHFKHPDCVTDCILKTVPHVGKDGVTTLTVHAYGFRTEDHTTYVEQRGKDGKYYSIPVEWESYHPVESCKKIYLREDNTLPIEKQLSPKERAEHINNVLAMDNFTVYRHHIASSLYPPCE